MSQRIKALVEPERLWMWVHRAIDGANEELLDLRKTKDIGCDPAHTPIALKIFLREQLSRSIFEGRVTGVQWKRYVSYDHSLQEHAARQRQGRCAPSGGHLPQGARLHHHTTSLEALGRVGAEVYLLVRNYIAQKRQRKT